MIAGDLSTLSLPEEKMSRRILCLCGMTIFVAGLATGLAAAGRLNPGNGPQSKVLLDNQRVTVTEVTMPPAASREPYTRPSDQIIVFIDDADYEATDAAGKKKAENRQ